MPYRYVPDAAMVKKDVSGELSFPTIYICIYILHIGHLYPSSDLIRQYCLVSHQKINQNVPGKSLMKLSLSGQTFRSGNIMCF